jgi:hypothetical protein
MITSMRVRWAWYVVRMVVGRSEYKVLEGKPEKKESLGRSRRKWEENKKTDLKEMGWQSLS